MECDLPNKFWLFGMVKRETRVRCPGCAQFSYYWSQRRAMRGVNCSYCAQFFIFYDY